MTTWTRRSASSLLSWEAPPAGTTVCDHPSIASSPTAWHACASELAGLHVHRRARTCASMHTQITPFLATSGIWQSNKTNLHPRSLTLSNVVTTRVTQASGPKRRDAVRSGAVHRRRKGRAASHRVPQRLRASSQARQLSWRGRVTKTTRVHACMPACSYVLMCARVACTVARNRCWSPCTHTSPRSTKLATLIYRRWCDCEYFMHYAIHVQSSTHISDLLDAASVQHSTEAR